MEPVRRGRFHRTASRLEAVERAEAYVRAHPGTFVRISRLSRIVGLSERCLRNAFYSVRGMSPKRRFIAERLEDARRALSDARHGDTTVTGVATRYGFYELGRFAASYKEAFGETPSATLRGHHPELDSRRHTRHYGARPCLQLLNTPPRDGLLASAIAGPLQQPAVVSTPGRLLPPEPTWKFRR